MIVSSDINPERDVYFLGAKVIEIMDVVQSRQLDFFDVFQSLNKNEKVSMGLFTLTLDWLFLAGVINKTNKGDLEKCF